eukprot:CAMPEP_0116882502 /NCGR_PEP_ID=MMETSP0463-20121206/14748_1 /TAXON_ID=181622 /ORGANISM="Strombidinopsis sp, Strain SopsisLIS2011" /LENGTH=107 /DNA_ID=CAMNT_0004535779 /DNA_START=294 /DNA_END=617 /DNA_ORIENTATION=+
MESFRSLDSWIKEVEKHSGDEVTIIILANKSDVEEDIQVSDADIKQFEEERKIPIIKTSAKTGENVDESFLQMTKELITKKNNSGDNGQRSLGLTFKKMQSTSGDSS